MLGISIQHNIGIGDKVQFSSLPENYFRATGDRLVDVSKSWIFDFNPHVVRDREPEKTVELWDFNPVTRPRPRPMVYLSNAEHHAEMLNVPVSLNRPRLYRFEKFDFEKRHKIFIHTNGKSHGHLPIHVIDHVLKKYKGMPLYQVGLKDDMEIGIPKIKTESFWDLAQVLSEARMFIGVDSGPSWIAACYPDVIVKKIRLKPSVEYFKNWVPLAIDNIHAHWDDRLFQIFNPSEEDIGFTSSYRKI